MIFSAFVRSRVLVLLALSLLTVFPATAQNVELVPVPIENDEGGPVRITGAVTYTNPFFTAGVEEPMVILEDQAGFVRRDRGFLMPPESQVLGQITSDFFTSPFYYSISLPIEPAATLVDVDNDGEEDTGVMVYAIAYWNNVFGPPELEERDLYGGGWSTAYVSTRVDPDRSDNYEIRGGTLLIYAPDDKQGFPTSWGDDGLLFTEDDPTGLVPQGYTLVNLDTDPFTFSRPREAVVDLIEGELSEVDDFSSMTYTEAFDAMIDKFRREYAFTEFKGIDWDAKAEEFRPLFEEAEAQNDQAAYEWALLQFLWSIPDGHVGMSFTPSLEARFIAATEGGLGLAATELSDGRIIASLVLNGGPAEQAGVEPGAELLAINGEDFDAVIENTVAWSAPFSTRDYERLQKLRYALRFPVGEQVELTFRNPNESEPETVTLTAIAERASFNATSFTAGLTGFELPVEYDLLLGGYGYVRIYSFFDNDRLTVDLWERMINTLNRNNIRGLIIDMRQNGGGNGFLADQLAAYFFDEPHVLGNTGFYDEATGEFVFDPDTRDRFFLPPEDQRYRGDIALIISPGCVSACEFFSYNMTIENRATVVGHYTTGGMGGSVEQFYMPGPINVQFTVGRAVDADGNIHIEGQGVKPDVRVPVTEESVLSNEDALLNAAIEVLNRRTAATTHEQGVIALDERVSGTLAFNTRHRYTFSTEDDVVIDIVLTGDTGLDTVLRVYDENGAIITENDDARLGTYDSAIMELEISANSTVIIEVGAYTDSGEGAYTLTVTKSII